MPNPTRYFSGTSLSYSINKDKIFLGTNEVDYGPSSTTKWYGGSNVEGFVIISDSFRQGLTTEANAYPIFWGTPTYTNNALLGLINELPERESLSPFSTLLEAVDWLDGSGKYLIQNFEYENFTTSGLTFLADASFCASYPLVGTTWYDLINGYSTSGNTNLFEFYPGNPVAEYGAITFDGSGGIATFTVDNNVRHTTTFTIDAWAYVRVFENSPILILSDGSSIQYSLGISSANKLQFKGSSCTLNSSASLSINTWYYLTISYNNGVIKFYINGSFDSQTTNSCVNNVATSTLKIGADPTTNAYFDGGVGICRVYNRELTATEILYNYNKQSTRYSVIPPPPTPSQTPSLTPTLTPTVTQTITPSVTTTRTPTQTISNTPSNTATPSVTPSQTITPSVTITRTVTPTVTPTLTPSQTITPSVTITRTVTPSVTPSRSATPPVTPSRTASPTPTSSTSTAGPTIVQVASGSTTPTAAGGTAINVTLNNVQSGNLLVLTWSSTDDRNVISSFAISGGGLTWTLRAQSVSTVGCNVSDNRIYTAVASSTGNITVSTSYDSFGNEGLSQVLYEVSGEESTLGGATNTAEGCNAAPSLNLTTTRADSLIFCVNGDWNANDGASRAYRSTPVTEYAYQFSSSWWTSYHWVKTASTIQTYTLGLTAPSTQNYGMSAIEIRKP